jgi:membrane-bound lytic murein transglycosylase A
MKPEYKYPKFWKILLAIYLVALFTVSLWPGNQLPKIDISHFDKFVHFSMYFILGLLFQQLLHYRKWSVFFMAFVIGTLIEVLQTQVPFRSFDLFDIMANSIGGGVGIIFSNYLIPHFLLRLEKWRTKYLLCLPLLFTSCARAPLMQIEDAMRPVKLPPYIQDSLSRESFLIALTKNIAVMKTSTQITDPMIFGRKKIEKNRYIAALEEILKHQDDWVDWINKNFEFYEVYGSEDFGAVTTTGYYQPMVKGSPWKTSTFSQALYMLPLPNPSFDRKDIDVNHKLDDQHIELAWVDPIDAFFIQIQGSAAIEFSNGEILRIGYAGKNGFPYVPIGKFLTSIIPIEQMSMQKIRAHLETLSPQDQQEIFNKNPSYVFFQKIDSDALTSSGIEVCEGRTIATDNKFFPKTALAFLEVKEPEFNSDLDLEPSTWELKPRLVFDQDTGGAIRGGGNIDLYFGAGKHAAQKAGVMKQQGKLYYLVPKS